MLNTKHRHFKIYKPYGYLSQFVNNQNRRKNKKLLGELADFPEGTMAIGRLDEKSEGLLLLTTDGKTSELIRSKKVEKEYFAQVDGIITQEAIDRLIAGVEFNNRGTDFLAKAHAARLLNQEDLTIIPQMKIRSDRHGPTSWLSITLTEGKFRQVRKMTAAVDHPTLRLVRVRIGTVGIEDLKAGEVIEIDESSF
ncbi:pseudouridine synthase [Marivirga atlantica]|uniref:Pseudouridine synthase n=1 Tax=Marivirga atlantica TaxID=1548457 RepID=A0A937A7B1_9BACT|nr:pseudouridine synthase [Marivirga atlantica]